MGHLDKSKGYNTRSFAAGAAIALGPFPVLLALSGPADELVPWRLVLAGISWFCIVFSIGRGIRLARAMMSVAVTAGVVAAVPAAINDPFFAFFLSILFIFAHYFVFDTRTVWLASSRLGPRAHELEQAKGATIVLPFFVMVYKCVVRNPEVCTAMVVWGAALIMSFFVLKYAITARSRPLIVLVLFGTSVLATLAVHNLYINAVNYVFFHSLLLYFLLLKETRATEHGAWLQSVCFDQPGPTLFWSFFLLCVGGSFCLLLPIATRHAINPIDAAFTAISAVCVTGLVVLDTARDFTVVGQLMILALIQLGGLGIMTITTSVFHRLGHRVSLHQESVMMSLMETNHQDLFSSLMLVLRTTFAIEGVGALVLFVAFYCNGMSLLSALWNGVFTAVSAFCNAGFMLTSDNLVSLQTSPVVLHTVAGLIVLGGIAPAMIVAIPAWLCGRRVPLAVHIVMFLTLFLLVAGTLAILVFEWNGILQGLGTFDKIHNAWFQSATLRTAGFNSVPLERVKDPTVLVMVVLMFIGGSPGGTAGGIKTTTVAILLMTFWSIVNGGGQEVTIRRHRVPVETVYRAVTIFLACFFIWLFFVLCMQVTQAISSREIVFEITSALGTVGLTIGATPRLDEIGKLIVMTAMFLGRIGPMTLFMFLATRHSVRLDRCPDLKINM